MFREGEVGGRGGGAICWEVRLEVVLEVRRGDEARGRGEGGTELRSGAMIEDKSSYSCFEGLAVELQNSITANVASVVFSA